jgi:hypothetical protein
VKHVGDRRLLDVEDLSPDGKQRLEVGTPCELCGITSSRLRLKASCCAFTLRTDPEIRKIRKRNILFILVG